MRFFTSDTHFGHARIVELSNRPFTDVDEMDEALISRWNEVVSPEDTVYHLGDVALGKIADSLPLVARLNGYKIMVTGNHDRTFSENKVAHRERFLPLYREVFQEVYDEAGTVITLSGSGIEAVLSHFPYGEVDHTQEARYLASRPVDNGQLLIHGHTHSTDRLTYSKAGTAMVHVGVDAWNYCPVSEDEIMDTIYDIL